jgi:hypothetical protein
VGYASSVPAFLGPEHVEIVLHVLFQPSARMRWLSAKHRSPNETHGAIALPRTYITNQPVRCRVADFQRGDEAARAEPSLQSRLTVDHRPPLKVINEPLALMRHSRHHEQSCTVRSENCNVQNAPEPALSEILHFAVRTFSRVTSSKRCAQSAQKLRTKKRTLSPPVFAPGDRAGRGDRTRASTSIAFDLLISDS